MQTWGLECPCTAVNNLELYPLESLVSTPHHSTGAQSSLQYVYRPPPCGHRPLLFEVTIRGSHLGFGILIRSCPFCLARAPSNLRQDSPKKITRPSSSRMCRVASPFPNSPLVQPVHIFVSHFLIIFNSFVCLAGRNKLNIKSPTPNKKSQSFRDQCHNPPEAC